MRNIRNTALQLSGIFGAIAVWQVVTMALGTPSYILPEPSTLVAGMASDHRVLLNSLAPLLSQAAWGFLFGNGIGIVLAIVVDRSVVGRTTIMPIALAIRSVPIVAIIPLITLLVGFGTETAVIVVTLITFFPTFINMTRGFIAVDANALEMFEGLGSSKWTILVKLRFPSAVPYLFTSLKVTAPAAILAATVAEYIATNSGLGYLIQQASSELQYKLMWEASVLTTLIVVIIFVAVHWFETKMVRWSVER